MIASGIVNGGLLNGGNPNSEPDTIKEEPDENDPDVVPDDQVVNEDFNLKSSRDPFAFRIGEEDFKIHFDLRIDYGKSNKLKIVTVDCEPNPYHSIFRSELLSRFTNNTGTKFMASICWRKKCIQGCMIALQTFLDSIFTCIS